MKTKVKQEKGITLIALVITIVVLLILAGVSINAIFSENGIINKAKDAQNKMDQATQNDLDSIDGLSNWIDSQTNGTTGGKSNPVTNPYADQQWTMAYVCNNGTWSDTALVSANGDTIPEGTQIVAKFYATGKKITPRDLDEGDEYKVVVEGTGEVDFHFNNNEKKYVTELILCDGITIIEHDAFWSCTSLTSIIIPNSVITIGESAFEDCISLTKVTIQNGVTTIGDAAFACCESLTSIIIPNSVITIGESAFDECTSLTDVTIQNSVTTIGEYAFDRCESLTSIIIPNSVITIGYRAFADCTSLTDVTIQNSVTTIEKYAFWKDEGETLNIKVSNEAIAKIVNGSYNPNTAKVIVANENSIAQNTINAKEVANHPVIYCGKEAKGYTCDNSAGISKWKIYHSDGKNIYLIADNYITGEYIPSKDGETMTASKSYTNAYYFNDTLLNKYTGSSNITDTNITPWLSYLKSSYGENNTNENMKATAYLLDTEIWKGFRNTTKAKYAIGAPTLDMFVASYNTRFARQIELISQEKGYKIGFKDEDTYYNLYTYDYLLAHKYENGKAKYMWLASPSADNSGTLMYVNYRGFVHGYYYDISILGVRPLVCLESEVSLEKQEINGEIVYNIK